MRRLAYYNIYIYTLWLTVCLQLPKMVDCLTIGGDGTDGCHELSLGSPCQRWSWRLRCGKAWSRNQILQMNSWNPILRWLKHHVWYFSPHYDWLICPIYPLILPIYTPHLSQLPRSCDVKAVMLADEKQHGVEKSVVYRVREGTINPWINAGLSNVMECDVM